MSMVEVDENAREVLRAWKKYFRQHGINVDYSESIRQADKLLRVKQRAKP